MVTISLETFSLTESTLYFQHIIPVHHSLLTPFCASSLICLPYINKIICNDNELHVFFPVRNCYHLPPSWSGVTSLPVKILNCHISWTRHTTIPLLALNLDLVTFLLYIKTYAILCTGTLCIWSFCAGYPTTVARGKKVTAGQYWAHRLETVLISHKPLIWSMHLPYIRQIGKIPQRCIITGLENSTELKTWKTSNVDVLWPMGNPIKSNEEMPITSYKYRSGKFHRTSNRKILSSGFRDMHSSLWVRWATMDGQAHG